MMLWRGGLYRSAAILGESIAARDDATSWIMGVFRNLMVLEWIVATNPNSPVPGDG